MFDIYYIIAKNFSFIVSENVIKIILEKKTRLLSNLYPENNLNNTMC